MHDGTGQCRDGAGLLASLEVAGVRVHRLEGPRGLADGDDGRVRSDTGDAVGCARRRWGHLGIVGLAGRGFPRHVRRRVRRWRWRWRRGHGLGDRHRRRRWRRCGRRWRSAGGRCARIGRRWARRRTEGRRTGHRRGHRHALRRSGDQRCHHGAVRIAVAQSVTAHDVVTAGHHRQPAAGVDPGVDDRDRHPVSGRVLPGLAHVEHREAGGGQGDVGIGDGDGPRAGKGLPYRLVRSGFAVDRHPTGIDDRRRNRLCRRKAHDQDDQQAGQCRGRDSPSHGACGQRRPGHRMRTHRVIACAPK